MRWVYQYFPRLNERVRKHLKLANDSWRIDEIYLNSVKLCFEKIDKEFF